MQFHHPRSLRRIQGHSGSDSEADPDQLHACRTASRLYLRIWRSDAARLRRRYRGGQPRYMGSDKHRERRAGGLSHRSPRDCRNHTNHARPERRTIDHQRYIRFCGPRKPCSIRDQSTSGALSGIDGHGYGGASGHLGKLPPFYLKGTPPSRPNGGRSQHPLLPRGVEACKGRDR